MTPLCTNILLFALGAALGSLATIIGLALLLGIDERDENNIDIE